LLRGENRFVCDAYRRASKVLAHFPEDILSIYEYEGCEGLRRSLKLGKAVISKICHLLESGGYDELTSLKEDLGEAVEFINVRGIGPKTARLLTERGIRTFEDLLRFLEGEEARTIFKSPSRVYESVRFYLSQRHLYTVPEARMIVESFLRLYPSAVAVGEYRRGEPIISVIEFAISEEDAFRLVMSGRYEGGYWMWAGERIPVRLHIYSPEDFGSVLVFATGPERHVMALQRLGDVRGETEEEVYERLGLPYIHPFQRYDGQEVVMALEGSLPPPVLPEDLTGDFHVHTTYSDGSMTPEEAVQAAIRRGYGVVALADHSPSSGGGLNVARLERKRVEIIRLREKYPYIRILHAAEVDILSDGSLDYPDEVLETLDFVIASIHNWGDEEDTTERLLKAMENPHVHVIGHPTGRVLKKRPSYRVDLDRLFRRAEETGKALEVNANPKRMDLDAYALLEGGYGGKVFLGSDAHREWDMDYMWVGCAQVSRARLRREQVGNL